MLSDHDATFQANGFTKLDRRTLVKGTAALGLGLAAANGPRARPARAQGSQAEGIPGGRLRVATTGQPAGYDVHLSSQRTITLIGWQMYEALFTFDGEYATVPMLAEEYSVSDDGLVTTIQLRQGVPFHNGEEMTAADVVASFQRWAPVSSLGLAIAPYLEEIVEAGTHTVEIRLTTPLVALPSMLARQAQGLSIHPRSVLEAAGDEPLPDAGYIGTGPYQFVERQADRFTLMRRFDGYASLDSPPSGYAGAKTAFIDELEFVPVPDEAARVAGLQAGEYDYLEEIIPDQIGVLEGDPNVTIEILPPRSYGVLIMNTVAGPMSNQTLRQAVLAAVAVEPTGQASHGAGYFEPGPGIMMPQTAWHSDAAAELYNQGNPDRARELATQAGYDGTPLRLLATQEDLGDYNAAVVIQQQLEEAGFTIALEVTDEATMDENLESDDRWEMTTNAYVFRPDPVLIAAFASCNADGQWCTDEKVAVVERLQTEQEFAARYEALEELQRLWYEQAPAVKLVNNYGVAALSARVQGLIGRTHFELEPEFANAWIAPD